ncbi:MAG: hypothetical protein K2X50_05400 [Gammaproteobacteria bacterium]|nr:hypothetical protein [Gammaproteobacteria bacterium]
MSKPLVEPISTASLSPLTWVRKLFIPDAMTGYISQEEFAKFQQDISESEKIEQRKIKRTAEDGKEVKLGEAPKKGSKIEDVFNRKTDNPEVYLAFSFKDLLKAAILKAYGFDGYNRVTNKYITARGEEYSYKDHAFNKLLHTVGFFGFPNRADNRETTKNKAKLDNETEEKEYPTAFNFPKLSVTQFLLNFVGGWHRDRIIIDENKKLKGIRANKAIKLIQIPASFFKVVIFALKWATFPFKFALNLVKFITEVFPTLISDATAQGIGYQVRLIDENNKADEDAKGYIIGNVALIGFLGLIYLPFKIAAIVGTALTSPAISAELAFATGRSFKIDNRPWATSILGITFGSIGIALSIGLTIALWSLGIPLVVGGAMTFAPAFFTPIVTWFLQLPLIGTTIGMIHGSLIPLSSVIGAAFTPYITAITGLAVGLQIPAEAIALGATLAVLVAPSASFLSFVAGKLSDYWALAGKYGMIGVFRQYYFPPEGYKPLIEDDKPDGDTEYPMLNLYGTEKDGAIAKNPTTGLYAPSPGKGKDRSGQQKQGSHSANAGSGTLEIFPGADDDRQAFESRTITDAELQEVTEGLQLDISPRSQKAAALAQQRKSSLDGADDATITAANAGRGASVEQSERATSPTRATSGGRGKNLTGTTPYIAGEVVTNKF